MNGRVRQVFQSSVIVIMLIISSLSVLVIIGGNIEGDSGGPDAFGYRWTDSNLPGPTVSYNWVEISGSGTNIGFHSDDGEYGAFPIGFTFSYYGNSKTNFYIANNGAILFNSGGVNAGNSQIPSTSSAEDVICPFWDDLYTSGDIYYQTLGSAPNRYLVVEWRNINHISYQSGYITFEVILYESSNRIKFQYQDVFFGSSSYNYGNSATVGIENIDGTIGLQYSYNTAALSNNLAIEFSRYTIDYIVIKDAPGPGGSWVGDTTYSLGNTDTFWAQGYNNSLGYIEDVNADWVCSNTLVGTVTTPGSSTTFDAVGGGICSVQATYGGSLSNSTGVFTIGVPPQIDNIILIPNSPNGTTPVTVYANITDPDGIGSATLYYSFDGVTFTPFTMIFVGGDTYLGTIPAPGVTTTVYYYIDTADNNGFANSSSLFDYVADSDIPMIGIPYIEPKCPNATVDVNVTFDIIEDTGIMNATLFYSYDGITWFNTTMSYLGAKGLFYQYDVETGPSGWTHYAISGPAGDSWAISSARSYTPINSWYSGPEPITSVWGDSCLESPLFLNLPSYTNLTFWHWYNFFSAPIDGGIVEINDGSGWVQITPVGGYDDTLLTGWQNPLEGSDAFTSSSGGWQKETFDLSAYTGADVRIRFHIGWNNFNDGSYEGWYVDNITLFSDYGGCAGVIPGPGYSTWVNYYAQVTDDAGNSNTSNVFTYFADGDPPQIIDISSITSPKATNAQIPVIVNITDNYGLNLNNVNLWYDSGSGWTSIPMAYVSGNYTNATFQGFIPPTIIETTVFYYVKVADNASNYNVSTTNSYLTNTPPSITGIIHIPQFPNGSMPVNVSCNITDIDGIGSATLYYSGDGITFTPIPMTLVGGDMYNGTIPGLGTPYVYYYIEASDTNGFSDISTTISFFVDVEPPHISVPNITPPNPNASADVNVSFTVWDNVGVDNVTLWYTYDMLTWYSTTVYNTSASLTGRNPPSGFTTGDLSATYTNNNQFITSLYVYAYSQDNDTLYVNIEGYNPSTSSWETIYDGMGGSGVKVDITYGTPIYTQWRILCDDTENNDNIDYNFIYTVNSHNAMIPSPGYSTWVYYYIAARDQANNVNSTPVYSYFVDGIAPMIVDITDVISPQSTSAQQTIFANITDDYSLSFSDIYLWYSMGAGWFSVSMNFISGNSTDATFRANIPASGFQTTIFYYVEASDNSLNRNISITKNYMTNSPPSIIDVDYQPQYPSGSSTVTVFTNITDSDGIGSVMLYYSTDGMTFTPTPMVFVNGNMYTGNIPPLGASPIFYYIEAIDTNGFDTSTGILSFLVDIDPPYFGVPTIVPEYPNTVESVDVSAMIGDNTAIDDATLWYTYDNIVWYNTQMSSSTYDLTGRNPAVGNTQGDLSATYTYFNQFITDLYVYAYSSDGDTLYVRIEGYNPSTGLWEIIYSSSGGSGVKVDITYPSPTYTQWKIFVDDTEDNDDIYYQYSYSVTSYSGTIPGPGYPTRVNYYMTAADPAGNTNSSPIYTYTIGSDLSLSTQNITFWPDPIQNGTAVLINATVYNQGGLLTGVEARFYDGNPDTDFDNVIDSGAREIGTPFVFDIASNTEALVQTSWTPGLRGLHEVYVWVDAINATWEWDDWNNLARKDLVVYDWLDNMLDETKIETKSNITIKDGQAELVNIGGSLSVVGTSYYSSVGGSSGSDYYAQSFNATENSVSGIGIYIAGSSTPYSDMRVALWGDFGGNPDKNNVIAVGDVISGSNVTSTGQRYYLNFSSPQPVVLGWRYWVVIDGYYDHNTSGRCRARYNSGNVYVDGIFKYSNNIGAFWSTPNSNYDLDFVVVFYRPALDGYLKSIEITLPLGMTWETLFVNKSGPGTTIISVTIIDGATEAPITGFIDIIDGVINISQIDPEQYPSIKLEGYLEGDGIASPLLLYWAINWVPCPKANAGPDDTIDEDVQYTFNGSTSWSSLGIQKYAWDIDANDGLDWDSPDYEGLDLWDPTHTYDTPGIYMVTLNVTDINGYWDTDTVVITVNDITPPEVDAGQDDTIDEDAIYNFDAGGSVDNSGTIVSYLWDMDASDGVDPSNPDYSGVSISHAYSEPGTYTVWLFVSDAAGNWNSTSIIITVFDITAPSADAGSDGSIVEDDTYFFDGTGSSDNVAIIFYNWTFGDGYYEYGINPTPQHTYTYEGIYAVNLRVTDDEGNWDEDSLIIYVNNVPPIADAGENKTENQGDPVTFDGSGCQDTPSDIPSLNYIWYFGDGTVGSGKVVNHVYSTVGNYIVTLEVNDNNGDSSSDTLSVQVIDGLPPHADCGNDAMIYQNSAHTFDGSGSYDNCGIANYAWDVDASDGFDWANPDYSGPEMVTPKHTYSQPDVYTVTLNVTDTSGFWDTDFVIITVVDSEHPIAVAGEDGYVDQNVPYQLDGAGSTDNTGIVMYLWDVDESDGIDWSEPDYTETAPVHIFTEPGPYVITLKVVDSDWNSDTDSITITVNETEIEENVPCAPTDLEILLVGTGDALELRWTEPTTNMDGTPLTDLLKYELYFRAREEGTFSKLTDVNPGTTSYLHSGLTANTTCYYYLVAVDTSFTRSSPSLMVSRIPNVDTDGDQIPNIMDTDDDNDGWSDTIEEAAGSDPLDDTSTPRDTDRDGTPDITDIDDDNDGHPDYKDDYPLDPTRWKKSETVFDWFWILVILIIILFCIIVLLVLRPWKRDEKEVKKISVDVPPPTLPPVPPTPMTPGVTAQGPPEESSDLPPVWAALYYGEEIPEKTPEEEPEEASAPYNQPPPPPPPDSQQGYEAMAQQTTPEEVPLPPAKGDEAVGRSVEGAEAVEPKLTAVMIPLAGHEDREPQPEEPREEIEDYVTAEKVPIPPPVLGTGKDQEPQPEEPLAGEEEPETPEKEEGTVEWIIEDTEEEAIPPPAIQESQPERPLESEEETAKPEKDIAPVEWIFEETEGKPVTPLEPEPITHEEGFEPAPLEPEIPKEETRQSPEVGPEPPQEQPAMEEETIPDEGDKPAEQIPKSTVGEPVSPPVQEPIAPEETPEPPQEKPAIEEEQITPHKKMEAQQPTSDSPMEEPSQPTAQEPPAQDETPPPPEKPVAEEPKKAPPPRPPENWKAKKKN